MIRFQFLSLKLQSLLHNTIRNASRVRRVPTQTEEKLKLQDNVPKGFELIYRAPMENYLLWTKYVAAGSTAVVVLLGGWKVSCNTLLTYPIEKDYFGFSTQQEDLWYYLGGLLLINIFISMFISRYPLRIYRNIDKYLAVYESQIPLKTAMLNQFQKGEVVELNHKLNPWKSISYRLGQRSSLLLIDYFKTPSEFTEMCGLK